MSDHSPWLTGAIGFGVGFLAHYLLQKYEQDLTGHLPKSTGASTGAASSTQVVELPLPLRTTKNNPKLETDTLNRKQNLEHVDFAGKRVLMRVDYNVKIVRFDTNKTKIFPPSDPCMDSTITHSRRLFFRFFFFLVVVVVVI